MHSFRLDTALRLVKQISELWDIATVGFEGAYPCGSCLGRRGHIESRVATIKTVNPKAQQGWLYLSHPVYTRMYMTYMRGTRRKQ